LNCAVLIIAGIALGFLAGVFAMGLLVSNKAAAGRPPWPTSPPTEENDQDGS